jgi:hypothetical protein
VFKFHLQVLKEGDLHLRPAQAVKRGKHGKHRDCKRKTEREKERKKERERERLSEREREEREKRGERRERQEDRKQRENENIIIYIMVNDNI